MQKPLVKSLIFHGIIVVLLIASSWSIFARKEKIIDEKPITVNLQAPIAAVTNTKPAPHQVVKPPAPKPPAPKPQPPKPKPEPKKPEPKPEPKPVVKPAIKPEPKKPEPKKPEPKKPDTKPAKKPEKPKKDNAELDSLLKDLDDKPPTPEKTSEEKNTNPDSKSDTKFDDTKPESVSEKDYVAKLVGDQVKQCWSPAVGAANTKNLVVVVNIDIAPDGTIKFAGYDNEALYKSTAAYQVMADAARRAVLDPDCSPLKQLPPASKYHLWKEMTVVFDPKDLN